MIRRPFRVPSLLAVLLLLAAPGATAEEAATPPAPHLFILSGQSNMTRTLSDSFRHSVEQVFGKERVRVTMTGHPGQPIKSWVRTWTPPEGMQDLKPENNGKLYERLLQNTRRTLEDRKPASVTFIWMQGEQDAGSSWGSVYERSFLTLLDQIRTDLDITDLHFVVGRINDYWLAKPDGDLIREIQRKLGDDHANGDWIDTDDLNRGVNPWGGFSFEDGHYPPAGYVVMGQRFARKACLLLDAEMELDPRIFQEHFIDSHEDIRRHAAIGKAVTVGPESAPQRHQRLLDGKFGGTDPKAGAWIGFAPSKQPVVLVVDLGESTVVEEIGVNMLLSSAARAEFPTRLIYSTSEDGESFQLNNSRHNTIQFYNRKQLKQMRAEGIEPQSILLLTGQRSASARLIKIEIETGDQWVFIDEIVVNPQP